ncbi:MAG: CBS domain-containing protein, partial [Elusimicrobia bacterium]|nr:CBS domain-containing protein [Elusimicrobiota bacterium]
MNGDFLEAHPYLALSPSSTLREALEALTRARIDMALVVGEGRRLVGVVSDTDIRGCLLKGGSLDSRVEGFMNAAPISMPAGMSRAEIGEFFRAHPKSHIPVVDGEGRLVGLKDIRDYSHIPDHFPNWVVVMAGGLGQRL